MTPRASVRFGHENGRLAILTQDGGRQVNRTGDGDRIATFRHVRRAANRLATLAVAAVLLLAVGSCDRLFPSDPIDPVGIHLQDDGGIEVIWQLCDDRLVSEFELGTTEEIDGSQVVTPVWHLRFAPPVEIDRLVLGDPPTGADEAVPWPDGGLESADVTYLADVTRLDSGGGWVNGFQYEAFRLADLQENQVYFERETMTPDDFDDLRGCG